jgi:hypothetical protein
MFPTAVFLTLMLAQQASMNCSNNAATQTQPLRGPAGIVITLKVSSADDHSKNTHLCNAEYQLMVMRPGNTAPTLIDLLTSDDNWDRQLFLRLYGFSQDGKRVFGALSEVGKTTNATLFDYDTTNGKVQLTDLRQWLEKYLKAKCEVTVEVVGTTENGAIVLEPNSGKQCARQERWKISAGGTRFEHLPQAARIVGLYSETVHSH